MIKGRRNDKRKGLRLRDPYGTPLPHIPSAEDYRLPFTLGNVPETEQLALDSCFAPVNTMLTHALNALGAEGLPTFPGYGTLTGLVQNSLIRAGVELRADDMTAKWGKFIRESKGADSSQGDTDEVIDRLTEDMEHFGIQSLINQCISTSGYYGGCLGFFDFGDPPEELANPLVYDERTIEPGSLKGIRKIEPYLVTPGQYNSVKPYAANYYKPDVWYVQGVPIHESRLFYISENELPALLKPAYNFFGISLSQQVLDAVAHFTSCRESANRLLEKYALTVFKTDMSQVLSGGFDTELQKRIDYFVQNRSNDGCATIDKEKEDLVVMTTSLSGVTDIVRQAMEYVAAMFNEPVTKMWGLSPAGFNTGDSDLKQHYENIARWQRKMLTKPMKKITDVLQLNAFGRIDPSVKFKWEPLSEEDENLINQNNKLKAERDAMLVDMGVVSPEEVRQAIIDDPQSGYNKLDPYADITPPPDLDSEEVTLI